MRLLKVCVSYKLRLSSAHMSEFSVNLHKLNHETMKNRILFIALAAVLAISCVQRTTEVEIIPIQDNVTLRLMPRGLFADAPDSLFEALGLQDGIPSSVCAFLAKSALRKSAMMPVL